MPSLFRLCAAIALSLHCQPAFALDKPPAPVSSTPANTKTGSDSPMLEMLGKSLCRGDDFTFRSCYSATLDQCSADATKAAKECSGKIPPPADISQAGIWGLRMGHCTEQVYHRDHAAKFSKDKKCQENLKRRQENYRANGTEI